MVGGLRAASFLRHEAGCSTVNDRYVGERRVQKVRISGMIFDAKLECITDQVLQHSGGCGDGKPNAASRVLHPEG
jgi:hypothetical protein